MLHAGDDGEMKIIEAFRAIMWWSFECGSIRSGSTRKEIKYIGMKREVFLFLGLHSLQHEIDMERGGENAVMEYLLSSSNKMFLNKNSKLVNWLFLASVCFFFFTERISPTFEKTPFQMKQRGCMGWDSCMTWLNQSIILILNVRIRKWKLCWKTKQITTYNRLWDLNPQLCGPKSKA